MKTYTKYDIAKIGNTIVYLAQKVPDLSKTKLLKLLYFLEESFVRKYNIPFLNLEYEVWQAGPVARDVFIDLSDEPLLLDKYITTEKDNNSTYIKAVSEFSDDEFSDNEIEMLDFVISKFGKLTAKELVDLAHRKGSNWYQIAKEKGLLERFESKLANSSEEKIDFTWYLDESGKLIYIEQVTFNKLVQCINA